jgi:peptide deformylase
MQLELLRLGHPLLRDVARPLSPGELGSDAIQQLIDDMYETMRLVNGAGLAAPQVGQSLRLCLAEVKENSRYPSMPALPLRVWVNPIITVLAQGSQVAMYEGCLSVPGLRGRVVRPASIRVDSLDREGMPQVDVFDGPLAAVAQHECDHLDGRLFVDLADPRTFTFLDEYDQFIPKDSRVKILR